MKCLIIGNGAAGINAAAAIREKNKHAGITIISDEGIEVYGRPLISYYLSGKVSYEQIFYKGKDFYNEQKIHLDLNTHIAQINLKEKIAVSTDGKTFPYDKLLLATGSVPFIAPTKNLTNQKNVFTFLTFDQADKIKHAVKPNSKVVIVGGGLIGLKAAEALHGKVGSITVVDLADRILASILDKSAANLIEKFISKKGINFILGKSVGEVYGDENVQKVILSDGQVLDCDILIIAIGVRPNVELAKNAGLEVKRAIVVNEKMQTSDPDVYAAGDCVQTRELLSNEEKILAIMPNATAQGQTAGFNMAGEDIALNPSTSMNAISFFGLQLICAGLTGGQEDNLFVDENEYKLRRLNIADDTLKGFVLINDIARAGIYTDLIKNQTKLSELEYDLKQQDIGLNVYNKKERHDKLWEINQ
ncbi:MAG: FAD-dependent oxidoreductase [Elusimicrobiota bacterium]|jgi:NAD(P)H-nitrite reductase large subunit|nr:FAD-dependent oxidoreductase [Elusimicrobiota bacterium]